MNQTVGTEQTQSGREGAPTQMKFENLTIEQQAALKRLRAAVDSQFGDTLGSIGIEDQVAFAGEGSWTGYNPVTWAELKAIIDLVYPPPPFPS